MWIVSSRSILKCLLLPLFTLSVALPQQPQSQNMNFTQRPTNLFLFPPQTQTQTQPPSRESSFTSQNSAETLRNATLQSPTLQNVSTSVPGRNVSSPTSLLPPTPPSVKSGSFNKMTPSASGYSGAVGDEYAHMGYPNAGYGNYDKNPPTDSQSVATPEEIESSYRQSLVNLKSQSGQKLQQPQRTSRLVDFVPQNSFLDLLKPQTDFALGLNPHLPAMHPHPSHSPFPEVYSTNSPNSPFSGSSDFHGFGQGSPLFKGVVESIPLSLQQQAALHHQEQEQGKGLSFSNPSTLVDVHYPPKIPVGHLYGPGPLPVGDLSVHPSPGTLGLDLKSDFRPSEPDHSKFAQIIEPPLRDTLFHPSPMSSGFSPSYGPPLKGGGSGGYLEQHHHHPHFQTHPQSEHVVSFPQGVGLGGATLNHHHHPLPDFSHEPNHHHSHAQSYHHQHQDFVGVPPTQSYESLLSHGQSHGLQTTSLSPTEDHHLDPKHRHPVPDYNFIFVNPPPPPPPPATLPLSPRENAHAHTPPMTEYLTYLADRAAAAAVAAGHEHQSQTHGGGNPIYQFQDSEESPSTRDKNRELQNLPPPNSFDTLFPTRPTRRDRDGGKRKKKKGHRGRRRHPEKYTIAINPNFKGKILPHHWKQLAELMPDKGATFNFDPYSREQETVKPKPRSRSKSRPKSRTKSRAKPKARFSAMGEALRKAYGIDPIFGGDLSETGKFTRSTSTGGRKEEEEGEDDESVQDLDEEKEEENSSSSEEKVGKVENVKEKSKTKRKSDASSEEIVSSTTPAPTSTSTSTTSTTTLPTVTTTPIPSTTTTTSTTPPPTKTSTSTLKPELLTPSTSTTTQPPTTITSTLEPSTTPFPTPTPTISSSTTTKPTTPKPSTSSPPTSKSNTTTTSQSRSVHFTISLLPKRKEGYDHEATSENRKALEQSTPSSETEWSKNSEESVTSSPPIFSRHVEYSSSSEEDQDYDSSSSSASLETFNNSDPRHSNGHQKIPLKIADDETDTQLVPLYFESSKMPRDFSSVSEMEDMILESKHKKKDLSSDMRGQRERTSKEEGAEVEGPGSRRKRKKIKPSLARRLINENGKKLQKVRKPKNAENYNTRKNMI